MGEPGAMCGESASLPNGRMESTGATYTASSLSEPARERSPPGETSSARGGFLCTGSDFVHGSQFGEIQTHYDCAGGPRRTSDEVDIVRKRRALEGQCGGSDCGGEKEKHPAESSPVGVSVVMLRVFVSRW